MGRTINLSDCIPIWKVENHLMLSKTQALTACLELSMPEAYSLSISDIQNIYEVFNRIIKTIPTGYILHKQDFYSSKYYKAYTESNSFLSKSYERVFNGKEFLNHKSYLYISKAPNGDAFTSNYMNSFITGRFIQRDIRDGLMEFENTLKKVMHILKSNALPAKLLYGKELTDLLNIYFNLDDQQILRDIQIQNNNIKIGENETIIYNSINADLEIANELDSNSNVDEFMDRSFTYHLGIGLQCPHIVNTIIRKNDNNRLVKHLGKEREKILSMSFKSRENTQLVDEYDTFLSDILNKGEMPIYVSQNIILWGKGEDLQKAENQLNNALAKMDIYTQRNFNCANIFFGCCPGNAYDLAKSEFQIQLSDAASMLVPIETNPKNAGINGIKLSERDYGIPIIVDTWVEPMKKGLITNRNMFILGPSGSGKSFFTNFMVRQLVEQGYHITIIDVGGSYRRLCQFMKGTYFEYTQENKMQFNPFYLPYKNGKYIVRNLEEYESLKTLLSTLWKGESGEITKEEYTVLSQGLNAYFEHIVSFEDSTEEDRVKSNFNAFYEFAKEQFPEIFDKELAYFDLDSFLMVLRPYYKGGEYDYLLNSPAEFSIADLKFCVFELDEIKDHSVIFPVVALVIMEAFIMKMRRHKAVRKMILIEEAWSAISNHGMASFLKYLYKTVRKFNGAVGIITQEVQDIIGNPFVKDAILNNADIQILLDMTKYRTRFKELMVSLGLQQSEKKKILSMNKMTRAGEHYKDVYIRFGMTGQVYSVKVSKEEVAMFTTEASDSIAIDKLIAQTNDHQYGIMQYLESAPA